MIQILKRGCCEPLLNNVCPRSPRPHPGWVGYGRSAAIHFVAGVGASVPPREMLEGEVGVKSGRGKVVASLASRSTSLLCRMSV